MAGPIVAAPSRLGVLAPVLRAVRQRRGMKVGHIAERMGLARRTYEYFEARSRLDWEKLKRFAAATRSDPCAILIGVAIDSPDFAARCVESRLAAQIFDRLRALDLQFGDALAALDPSAVAKALDVFSDALAEQIGVGTRSAS